MMDAVDEFRRKYSNITLTLRDASSAQARTLLAGGEVDFAISSMEEAEEFTSVPILSDRYGVVCRKDFHLAESTGPVQWAELGSEHFVGFTPDTGTGTLLQKRLGNLSIVSDPHDEASSTTSLYAFLRRGQCYSILPYLSASMFGDPDLVFRPLARPVLCRDICLVTRRLRAMSPSSERLIEVVNLVVGRKIQGRAHGGFSRPHRRQR
jgi:DNA-binding transcriptional LysR family regulator